MRIWSAGSVEETVTEFKKNETDLSENNVKSEVNGKEQEIIDSIVNDAAFKVQLKSLLPHELELRSAGAEGVWSTTIIPCGTKYGPFIGKWLPKPIDVRFAWEVNTNVLTCYLFIM